MFGLFKKYEYVYEGKAFRLYRKKDIDNYLLLDGIKYHIIKSKFDKGDYFKEGHVLCFYSPIDNHDPRPLFANFNGKIERFFEDKKKYVKGDIVLSYIQDDGKPINLIEEDKKRALKTEIYHELDDFEDKFTVGIKQVGEEVTPYFKVYEAEAFTPLQYLGITLINHNDYNYLEFRSVDKEISLAKYDELIMLFQDGDKLKLSFLKGKEGRDGVSSNYVELSFELLNSLLTKKIEKIKYICKRKNQYTIFSVQHNMVIDKEEFRKPQYETSEGGAFLFNHMIKLFIDFNQKLKR